MDDQLANAVAERYEKQWILAAYLEAEWGDHFEVVRTPEPTGADPRYPIRQTFYADVADLVTGLARARYGDGDLSILDIGGGTGRFLYEWLLRNPHTANAVLIEPSVGMTRFARAFLEGAETVTEAPYIGTKAAPQTQPFRRPTPPSAVGSLTIHNAKAEEVELGDGSFEIVCCLNVVDRHNDPVGLIAYLAQKVKPGGLLVISTPFDWEPDYTPPEQWFMDLRQVTPTGWGELATKDFVWDFRYTLRKATRFLPQVAITAKPA
jgi:SAM-dependent methyltransferase